MILAARRAVWLTAIKSAPALPRSPMMQRIRERAIAITRMAPLELCVRRGDTAVLVGVVPTGEIWDMVRLVGPAGRVIAVEPFPESVTAIEAHAKETGAANLTVIAKGAWSEPGKQTLYIHPQFAGSHIVLDSGAKHDRALTPESYAGRIDIEVDRLDDMLEQAGIAKPDFIKITVMGAEMQVLKGMDRVLRTTPRLWVKAHSLIDGKPANVVISGMLRERGYRTVITRGNQGPHGERPGDVYASR